MLKKWGLTEKESKYIEENNSSARIPGRIIFEGKNIFKTATSEGIVNASLSGRMLDETLSGDSSSRPAAGDWVWLKAGNASSPGGNPADGTHIITELFPRRSRISRKSAGERTVEQVIAANIDIVFIVMSLEGGRNFNLRALERYVTLAWESGARPVILLNKTDLCDDFEYFVLEAENTAPGAAVIPVSVVSGNGLDLAAAYLNEGITAVFIGPSGVGKSTLTNYFTGEQKQNTGDIREDDKRGRHTTSSRTLFQLETGAVIIDSPGLREIQLWAGDKGGSSPLDEVFREIELYARVCRFSDCSHTEEPGCAVISALEEGQISRERYESYLKLRKELEYLEGRKSQLARIEKKEKGKNLAKQIRTIMKERKGR